MSDDKLAEIEARHTRDEPWFQRGTPSAVTFGPMHEDRATLLGMVKSLRRERDKARQTEDAIAEERGVALALVEHRTRERDEARGSGASG